MERHLERGLRRAAMALWICMSTVGCAHQPTSIILLPKGPDRCAVPRMTTEELEAGQQSRFTFRCGPKTPAERAAWEARYVAAGYKIASSPTFMETYGRIASQGTTPVTSDGSVETACGSVFGFTFSKGSIHGEIVGGAGRTGKCDREFSGRVQHSRLPSGPEPWRVAMPY